MAEHRYEPHAIERKWQGIWERERTWEVSNDTDGAPRSYVLEMLPYPSGEPHMGHLKNYSVGDAVAHFRRRNGMRVLHPMGYDAFGLPAENNAIKTGEHPRKATEDSIASFQRQFREWGISIDWSREFGTHLERNRLFGGTVPSLTRLPPTEISPPDGSSKPAIRCRSVLLPQPLGPTIETNSPALMVALTELIA